MLKKFLCLVIFFFPLVGCTAEYSAVYQSVGAQSKWDESARILINNADNDLPLYKVVNKQLYLMIQKTRVDWFFRKVVNYPTWDKTEVADLVEQHADIESLFPDEWNNWLPKGFGDECKGSQLSY